MPQEALFEKKTRKPRTSTAKETFVVRVNAEWEIQSSDKMTAQAMILAAIAKLKLAGCVGRQVKWSGVFTQEERAALNKPKDRHGKFVAPRGGE